MQSKQTTVEISGQTLIFETGKIARQAGGSVLLRYGDTVLFSSACSSPQPAETADFMPLRVDYQEKFSSAGKTVGGFFKREGRATERETLLSRLIDRPLRPMIEEGFLHEMQLLCYVWSYDGASPTEPLAICCSSAAMALSEIPLIRPVAAVRVGYLDGKFIVNPTVQQLQSPLSKLDLVLAGTEEGILMIEGSCEFLQEEEIVEALQIGHANIKKICHAIGELQQLAGKPKLRSFLKRIDPQLISYIEGEVSASLQAALNTPGKMAQEAAVQGVRALLSAKMATEAHWSLLKSSDFNLAWKEVQSKLLRQQLLKQKKRCDGRALDEIRPIQIEQGILPRVHGSSLFTRGETQTLAICTLGGEQMAQRFETITGEGSHRFYLQYFFPPYSVGEVGRIGAPGRREIGHGKLAERALLPLLPAKEQFPYTIRIESNITESNGSSSMASVCGGALAMMNAGIPLKSLVAGIAMGLVLEGEEYIILSDILGVEDALGDMDFKIAGCEEGITSFQMDIKIEGISPVIMMTALKQAKRGLLHILGEMKKACPTTSPLSEYAPRIETLRIKPSQIATIIGRGGEQIRAIIKETGVEIDINDDGLINLSSADRAGLEKAKQIIHGLTAEAEIGAIYNGKVTSIVPFGLFVEILPGKEGLCHISEFAHSQQRIQDLNEFVKVGDRINVKLLDINERGQLKLSRKATLLGSKL